MPDDPNEPKEVKQDVNSTVNPSPAEQEPVNEPTEGSEPAESPPQESEPDQETNQGTNQETTATIVNHTDIDDRGISWKNRAIEAERKAQEIPQLIRQTVEEVTRNQQPKKEEYTREHIPALRKYANENPSYADWVETQIEDIRSREIANVVKKELGEIKQAQTNEINRQQSEQWVMNHPKFKECFVKDITGNTQWNYNHPLTSIIGKYLNQVDPTTNKPVKDRPDALMVASKMAYADYILNSEPVAMGKVNQLKKELRKTQKAQITPGGGAPSNAPARSTVKKSLEEYNKTYNSANIQSAVKAFLVADGILKDG